MFYTGASVKRMTTRKGQPWRGVLQYKDPDTKLWRQVTKTFPEARTKTEAKVELNKWRAEMEAKASLKDTRRTVAKAIESFLDNQRNLNQLTLGTYQREKAVAERLIYPYIGSSLFVELSKNELQEYINKLAQMNYSPSTIRCIFKTISKTYKDALKLETVLKDPTIGVVLPRSNKTKINYLGADSRRKFLAICSQEDCACYLEAMIAYYTGMRASEICALQWKDIDLVNDVISVNKAAKIYKDAKGHTQVEVSAPKTQSSIRTIPIMPALHAILMQEAVDNKPDSNDYVTSRRNPNVLCVYFLRWARRNELIGEAGKPITMHGLRHTFATLGVQSGMDIKSLSSVLGHTSTAMTLDVYASDDEQAKRYAMDSLSRFFESESESDL